MIFNFIQRHVCTVGQWSNSSKQLHCSDTRGAQVSTVLAPPLTPPTQPGRPTSCFPSPPCPTQPSAVGLHMHCQESIFPASFQKEKQDEGALSVRGYSGTPPILSLFNTHTHTPWRNVHILKFKGTKSQSAVLLLSLDKRPHATF